MLLSVIVLYGNTFTYCTQRAEELLEELQELLTPDKRRLSDHVSKQVARTAAHPKATANTKKRLHAKWLFDHDDDTVDIYFCIFI